MMGCGLRGLCSSCRWAPGGVGLAVVQRGCSVVDLGWSPGDAVQEALRGGEGAAAVWLAGSGGGKWLLGEWRWGACVGGRLSGRPRERAVHRGIECRVL